MLGIAVLKTGGMAGKYKTLQKQNVATTTKGAMCRLNMIRNGNNRGTNNGVTISRETKNSERDPSKSSKAHKKIMFFHFYFYFFIFL